jgi:hypothetical protein
MLFRNIYNRPKDGAVSAIYAAEAVHKFIQMLKFDLSSGKAVNQSGQYGVVVVVLAGEGLPVHQVFASSTVVELAVDVASRTVTPVGDPARNIVDCLNWAIAQMPYLNWAAEAEQRAVANRRPPVREPSTLGVDPAVVAWAGEQAEAYAVEWSQEAEARRQQKDASSRVAEAQLKNEILACEAKLEELLKMRMTASQPGTNTLEVASH